MGSDVIFGQYIKGDSVIHQLDARMKIIIAILYIVIIFLAHSVSAFILLIVATAVFIIMTKIPLRLLLKAI